MTFSGSHSGNEEPDSAQNLALKSVTSHSIASREGNLGLVREESELGEWGENGERLAGE